MCPFKPYHRRQFIKLATAGALGLYLTGCNSRQPGAGQNPMHDTIKQPPLTATMPAPEDAVFYKQGDAEYEQLRQGFNKVINKYPAVIALCNTAEGVSAAVKYAKAHGLPVAIKSGGHCLEGFSVNNGGMVINLSPLNSIRWLDEENIAVGPACKLGSLYEELLPKGRMVPGGSCAGVAIGGLTLGGGYGIFSRRYGLTCDSLLEVTMVDGEGNIISSNSDAELLWACRGGGSGNFGVITEMKFKTHKAPATLQSHWFKIPRLDASAAAAALEQWFTITQNLPVTCFSGYILNGKTLNMFIADSGTAHVAVQPVIEQLSAIASKTTLGRVRPIADAVKAYYGHTQPVYFKNSSAGLYKNFDDIRSCIRQVCEVVTATPGMIYTVNTLGGKIDDALAENGSCFPHRGRHYLSELQTYWQKPGTETKMLEGFGKVQQIFTDNGINTQYRNYPSLQFKNWQENYYGSNYNRLQAVKARYDAGNLFRYAQSISTG